MFSWLRHLRRHLNQISRAPAIHCQLITKLRLDTRQSLTQAEEGFGTVDTAHQGPNNTTGFDQSSKLDPALLDRCQAEEALVVRLGLVSDQHPAITSFNFA
jgi:hypothetical protein